jgi:hypothetical protein
MNVSVNQYNYYLKSRFHTTMNLTTGRRIKCEVKTAYGHKKVEAQQNLSRDINILGMGVRPGKHLRHRPVLNSQLYT